MNTNDYAVDFTIYDDAAPEIGIGHSLPGHAIHTYRWGGKKGALAAAATATATATAAALDTTATAAVAGTNTAVSGITVDAAVRRGATTPLRPEGRRRLELAGQEAPV